MKEVKIDGNNIGTADAIVTVFSGYGEETKFKRFMLVPDGHSELNFVTLEDCRKMIGETKRPVTVIFEHSLSGVLYQYGNYGPYWVKIGETQGYA